MTEILSQADWDRLSAQARRNAVQRVVRENDALVEQYTEEERAKVGLPRKGVKREEFQVTVRNQLVPPEYRFLIVAKDRFVMQKWCRDHGIQPNGRRVIYASDQHRLRGLRSDEHNPLILVLLEGWQDKIKDEPYQDANSGKSSWRPNDMKNYLQIVFNQSWEEVYNGAWKNGEPG
jgi:hypothetical protein